MDPSEQRRAEEERLRVVMKLFGLDEQQARQALRKGDRPEIEILEGPAEAEVVDAEAIEEQHLPKLDGPPPRRLQPTIHTSLGHQFGTMGGLAAAGQSQPSASHPMDRPGMSAADIAQLLHNPATIRQAVLLSEILRRPEQRWDELP